MNTLTLDRIIHPSAHRAPDNVEPGMRYKQAEQLGRTWVVKRKVEAKAACFPHVMIACEDFEQDTRVIAESALMDTHFFRYLPEKKPRAEKQEAKKPITKKTGPKRKAKKKS